jgi:pimeloyl-ACP methyl ester carboxylesterase
MGAVSPFPLTERKRAPFPFSRHYRRFSSGSILKARASDGIDDMEIPLVFLHGVKGSHLAFPIDQTDEDESTTKSQRSWLSLGGLLNFPPREDGHPERDISLPLSYTTELDSGASFPVQDRSEHFVDGTVDHVVELSGMLPGGVGGTLLSNTGNLDFFPFYGHATKFLEEINEAYVRGSNSTDNNNHHTSDDLDQDSGKETSTGQSSTIMKPRPTRSFCYDWRRNLFEVAEEFHAFCEREFPNGQPVQVVAHSMGGLIAYAAMKQHPSKYEPGGVLVGVPFGTGIQYLQDMHKGYFTELGTCRQFLPPAQFSFSSHWIFFPMDQDEIGDSFVDVSEYFDGDDDIDDDDAKVESIIAFEADRSTIGKKTSAGDQEEATWRPATPGKPIEIDFYDPEEWEKNEFGIFDPFYRQAIDATDSNRISEYKQHMQFQLNDARRWRTTVLAPWKDETTARNHMPPLTICSSVSIPTGNQILRRKRRAAPNKNKVYDYFPGSLISLSL